MQHSWCSCSAIAIARAAVVLFISGPVERLVRLVAIGLEFRGDACALCRGETGSPQPIHVGVPYPDDAMAPLILPLSPHELEPTRVGFINNLPQFVRPCPLSFFLLYCIICSQLPALSSLNREPDARREELNGTRGGGESRGKSSFNLFVSSLSDLPVLEQT